MRARPNPSTTSGIRIETPHLALEVPTRGYVSGIRGGSFLDRKTGARDLGFGLAIAAFLLEPALADAPVPPDQYAFGAAQPEHGRIPKRYAEGPQICTQAGRLNAGLIEGADFTAVKLGYTWTKPYAPHGRAGSRWEQTIVVPHGERFVLCADRVETVLESDCLFLRIDMPGHIRHEAGRGFEHVYLSYHDPGVLPSTEFAHDFGPDERFLYTRTDGAVPDHFIRAYQVRGPDGPWLAGITLNPADVYQAWCHQRGYVCLIQEIGGRSTRPGDVFGACYLVGWFDDLGAMHAASDRYRGWSRLIVDEGGFRGE